MSALLWYIWIRPEPIMYASMTLRIIDYKFGDCNNRVFTSIMKELELNVMKCVNC